MSKVVIISGSPSEQSRIKAIQEFTTQFFQARNIEPEVIEVRNLPPKDLIQAKFDSKDVIEANQKVEKADIVVLLSPVYKASYSGVLKVYLDLLPQNGLANKTILPLFIGGTISHLLAIDYALNPVLTALGATHLLKGAFIVDSQIEKLRSNQYQIDEIAQERLDSTFSQVERFLLQTQ
ncbi:NADPH-dependent FMN reductase [Cytobacillus sp. Hz8]|uniref:NADPH-dependent FMN reductase n=1 Tax=Cytobacillus sp. Hz8 TaxID=3347168 RepID=UPI0035DEBDCD